MEDIGTEQEKAHRTRDNILMLATFIAWKLVSLNSPPDDYDAPYTPQEKIALREKIIKMMECLVEGEKYAFFVDRIAWAYLDIGELYAEIGDYDCTLENLKLAADCVIMLDRECDPTGDNYNPDRTYTSLLLRGMKYSHINCTMSMSENYSMLLLNSLNKKSFDPIRGNSDFVELQKNLKKYAKNKIQDEART